MRWKRWALAAVMAVALIGLGAFEPAQARSGHHGGHFGGMKWGGGGMKWGGGPRFIARSHVGGIHFRRHHHVFRRGFVGVPLAYGAYYGGGCYWLRQRAIYTGNPYWWSRYQACLSGYYY